ncbi:hypothetical protein PENTCL1PPCAC_21865, partial [Pristionchus entomophagus]
MALKFAGVSLLSHLLLEGCVVLLLLLGHLKSVNVEELVSVGWSVRNLRAHPIRERIIGLLFAGLPQTVQKVGCLVQLTPAHFESAESLRPQQHLGGLDQTVVRFLRCVLALVVVHAQFLREVSCQTAHLTAGEAEEVLLEIGEEFIDHGLVEQEFVLNDVGEDVAEGAGHAHARLSMSAGCNGVVVVATGSDGRAERLRGRKMGEEVGDHAVTGPGNHFHWLDESIVQLFGHVMAERTEGTGGSRGHQRQEPVELGLRDGVEVSESALAGRHVGEMLLKGLGVVSEGVESAIIVVRQTREEVIDRVSAPLRTTIVIEVNVAVHAKSLWGLILSRTDAVVISIAGLSLGVLGILDVSVDHRPHQNFPETLRPRAALL